MTTDAITNKRKKRRSKRLLLLLLLLLITGIMLGTSTYAWFTANKTVTVSDITVNVETKNGIQISVDAQNWKSVVQTTDITGANATYASSVNQLPNTMEPVSTIGEMAADGTMNMYYGVVENSTNCTDNESGNSEDCTSNGGTWITGTCTIPTQTTAENCKTAGKNWISGSSICADTSITDASSCSAAGGTWNAAIAPEGNYILTATKETDTRGTEGRYVVFDLFFQVNVDTTVYMNLGASSGVVAGITDSGIQNASRIAFVNLGHQASGAAPSAYQALNNGTSSTVQIWEPNYDTSTQTGVNNALSVYDISTTTSHEQLPYVGVKAPISLTDNQLLNSEDTNFFGPVTTAFDTTNGQTGQVTFGTLLAGVTKYRVYMWIEGQDVDCENEASGGQIIYRLQFTTTAAA